MKFLAAIGIASLVAAVVVIAFAGWLYATFCGVGGHAFC